MCFLDSYVMLPSLSPGGISIAVKFRCDKSGMKEDSTERFIFDTGGWLGRGVSLFVFQGQLTAVLGYKGRIWVVRKFQLSKKILKHYSK